MKMRIESHIQVKHESTSLEKKLNIINYYDFEMKFKIFHRIILDSTINCKKFWSELLEKEINP